MKSAIGRWLHDQPNLLRAVIGVAPGAVPLVAALFAAVFVHQASALQSEMVMRAAAKVSFEDSTGCQRRGLAAGSHEHLLCMMDLNAKRAEEEAEQSTTQAMLLP